MDFVKRKLYGTVMEVMNRSSPPKPETRRDDKRNAILRIAYAAFLEDGFAATSMSSIAAKVGGSKATLYNYFPSKEELFAAVIDEKCQELQHVLFDDDTAYPDFRSELLAMGERLGRAVLADEKIATYRLITAETGRFPELGRAFYHSGPRQSQERLARYFDEAVANGHLRAGDTLTMSQHFFELAKGDLHHRKLWGVTPNPSDNEIRRHAHAAVDAFLRAYAS
jgi:TetR/AcrR family transcriptional repressor of mexJK operon